MLSAALRKPPAPSPLRSAPSFPGRQPRQCQPLPLRLAHPPGTMYKGPLQLHLQPRRPESGGREGRGGEGRSGRGGEEREERGGALGISKLGAAGGAVPRPGPLRGRRISGAAGRSQWGGVGSQDKAKKCRLGRRTREIQAWSYSLALRTAVRPAPISQRPGPRRRKASDPGPDPAPACAPERQGRQRRLERSARLGSAASSTLYCVIPGSSFSLLFSR